MSKILYNHRWIIFGFAVLGIIGDANCSFHHRHLHPLLNHPGRGRSMFNPQRENNDYEWPPPRHGPRPGAGAQPGNPSQQENYEIIKGTLEQLTNDMPQWSCWNRNTGKEIIFAFEGEPQNINAGYQQPGGPRYNSGNQQPGGPRYNSGNIQPGGPEYNSENIQPGRPGYNSGNQQPGGPRYNSGNIQPGGPEYNSENIQPGRPGYNLENQQPGGSQYIPPYAQPGIPQHYPDSGHEQSQPNPGFVPALPGISIQTPSTPVYTTTENPILTTTLIDWLPFIDVTSPKPIVTSTPVPSYDGQGVIETRIHDPL